MKANTDILKNNIEEFINWYNNYAIKFSNCKIGEFFPLINIEKLIEKLTIFYELKYSNDYLDKNSSPIEESTYDKELLLKSLSWYEKFYLLPTSYTNIIHIAKNKQSGYILLNSDGYITGTKFIKTSDPNPFIGMHIKELSNYVNGDISFENIKELDEAIKNYEIQAIIKKNILLAVASYIIIRENNRIGYNRAKLFIDEYYSLDNTIEIEQVDSLILTLSKKFVRNENI